MEKQDLETIQRRKTIQRRIGYNFNNYDLLQQAFIRKSYAKENGGEDNEVLEFIGDKVLDMVVVKILSDKFGYFCHECDDFDKENDFDEYCCECTEGQLTELKKKLVKKETLADVINSLQLHEYLILGKGDEKNEIYNEASVQEDLFEAIIGAVALDSEWNWDRICDAVEFMLDPYERIKKNSNDNYFELIREWSLSRHREFPSIDFGKKDSPNGFFSRIRNSKEIMSKKHEDFIYCRLTPQEYSVTHYYCRIILKDIDKEFLGIGKSVSEARKDASEVVYDFLEEKDLLFTIRDEIENPNKNESINQLETLARRGYFSIPTYNFEQEYDENGNPIWKCECHIEEYKKHFNSKSSSKKDAKKSVAFKMLQYVLNEEEE